MIATPLPKVTETLRAIRVFVADDSFAYRAYLRELVASQADMVVVGEAANGYNTAQRVQELAPDVVILDLRMPGLDGQSALRRMQQSGTPARVIVVSAFDDALESFEGKPGEVAAVLKKGHDGDASWNEALIANIRAVGAVRRRVPAPAPVAASPAATRQGGRARVLLIGAAAGDAQAVANVLKGLPRPLPIPALVVVAGGAGLSESMAERLARESGQPVRLARHGESLALAVGQFLLAPDNAQMTVRGGRVCIVREPLADGMRPSVDALFDSCAKAMDGAAIGVLLGGSGSDGVEGLTALRGAGARTLAQDCPGMPGQSARHGAAERVMPLEGVIRAVRDALDVSAGRSRLPRND